MPPEESLYPRDWLRIADKDWRRAERALAYLLSKGWELKRIRDLETLVNEATRLDVRFRGFEEACRKISGYYLAERYPTLSEFSLTLDEVRESRNQIRPVVDIIKQMFR